MPDAATRLREPGPLVPGATHTAALSELIGPLSKVTGFAEVVTALAAGHGATLDGVWGSSCALAVAALESRAPSCLVLVTPHPNDLDAIAADLALFTTAQPWRFPASQPQRSEHVLHDELLAERLQLLKRLSRVVSTRLPTPRVIVTSIQALLQPVPSIAALQQATRRLVPGASLELDELTHWLATHGFQSMSGVELPGEFSIHGGIVDVFAPDWEQPVRIEFCGDEIESLRRFDVATQRSLTHLESVDLTCIDEAAHPEGHLADYLPADAWWLLREPTELETEGRTFLDRVERAADHHSVRQVWERMLRFPTITAEAVSGGSLEATCHLQIESVERFQGDLARVRQQLDAVGAGQTVWIVCPTEGEIQRLGEVLAETRLAQEQRLRFAQGTLEAGFRLVPARTTLLSSGELFQRAEALRPSRQRLSRAIDSFLELREGDYVVHVGHGIARYLGLRVLEKPTGHEEHLELEFREGTRLFVPVSRISLVQKYVGGSRARPTLAKLGGRSWGRQKSAVESAVADMALEMLDLQAVRADRPGISFPTDTEWQHEFDAAFPYQETADQLVAIRAVKADMHLPRPMDRLICGDVGYGKTEVAMRAAFKAVDSGYQVAVLVPTTVLAEQHRRTFTSRMAEYPFEIASLSRFLTRKEQSDVLSRLATGDVDIVIGTHRLVQPDVQIPNLGLVIIDEEQRFGVDVKERLKALRQIVDVLTLTATPIPRTLHMSLVGLRDISNLETPPEERLAVETRVTRFAPELVRQAILRELNRNGQAFFVHNRVHDIQQVKQRLEMIVPEARVRIAHGQMPEHELEEVMLGFVGHEFDVLLATTIIESGLDIPNANTIFIDQADIYGLADLHQLRGRVGRYRHRAYCYLLLDPNTSLTAAAARRLRAVEEFSDIGAGFAIAMRDLEIRGAGNILGTQQSGHIATVGYELYCELLEQAVRRVKNEPEPRRADVHLELPGEAYLPRGYIPNLRHKIDLYRRFTRLGSEAEVDDLAAELVDRFGPLPDAVLRMLDRARLRVWASAWRIESIHIEETYLVLAYCSREQIDALAARHPGQVRVVDDVSAYVPMGQAVADFGAIFRRMKSLLLSN